MARVRPSARARGTVVIAPASDAEVRALNLRYRRKGTRRLTSCRFPSSAGVRPMARSPEPVFLGDLVIATGVARRQAAQAHHSCATELKVLALHGLLHLLGYDHHALDDNGRMARVEARLRRRGGLSAGLIERAGE
jgi:probable rRNA maturation factor